MAYDLQWLDLMGLCHKCGKQKKFPGRQFCQDCLEKIAEYNAKYYDPQKAHEYQTRRRELYRQKKEAGICVRCTKPATKGLYCIDHYIYAKRQGRNKAQKEKNERWDRGLVPAERASSGLCLWCGAPATRGAMACAYHRQIFSEAGKKGGAVYWKNLNKVIFRKSANSGDGLSTGSSQKTQ